MSIRREHRRLSQRTPSKMTNSGSHIVEENLNKKSQLIDKYQTEIQGLIQQMGSETSARRRDQSTDRKVLGRSRLASHNKQTIPYDGSPSTGGLNDYQKLILGLEYSLQNERNRREALQNKNNSLQTQISNLRNLLVGPDQNKHYQKTVFKQYQEKINILEAKLVEQKKNYEFIIDSKNQSLATLQFQLRTLEKNMKSEAKQHNSSKKMLELMATIEELKTSIIKKNITIEKMRFHNFQNNDSQSDEENIEDIAKQKKIDFYYEQLQISNRLILRKNIQILNISKKTLKYQQILDVIQQYLDKKEVKNIDLNVLEHACVNKLRLLLRQKAVFERQLLTQLNQHNKKISNFEQEIVEKDKSNGGKIIEVVNDNKRLTALVTTLQNNIKNYQKQLQDQRRQEDILRNQIEINKRQFVEDVRKLKQQLNTISSVTKNEFDRMKIQNLKLSEQNRSLLFLVGEKEKQIHKKGSAIKDFEQYKDKINNLDISGPERRKIENAGQDLPQVGSKILLINTFSNWMMQWNKVRNWNNKKVLLNLILDKEQIRQDSLGSIHYLINVLHQCFLNSKNIDIQERAIILLSHYIKNNILKNVNLFLDKISPLIVRGFRGILEGQDQEKSRILNEATLKIVSSMERNQYKWSQAMTNEMLTVNGLKYLFGIVGNSQVDQLVESAYNCLIMIARQNEMISFMNSFNITTLLLNYLNNDYPFIIYTLHLLRILLKSRDYLKSQKSLLQFRKIFSILKKQDDEETVDLTLDCALILMQNTLFVKSLNKIQTISIISQSLKNVGQYQILKKIGQIYTIIITQMEIENVPRMVKEVDKMLEIVRGKKFNETRFNRAVRIVLRVSQILVDNSDLDSKIVSEICRLYENYEMIQSKTRIKVNAIINTIFDRNKEVINKYSNQDWIVSLIEGYKATNVNQQLLFLLKILLFHHQQKRTTEILRNGRQSLISKHINDSLIPDFHVALPALRNLLAISKQKYAEKFVNKTLFSKLVKKVLSSRNEQQFISTTISVLYFFSKNEDVSLTIVECGAVQKVLDVVVQRHDKETLIFKCFTLLELLHTTNYKLKVLNHLLANDPNLHILKTINYILKKAKNKQEMGTRVVFIYDFLNGKTSVQSLALLTEQNIWMVGDLIEVRNTYVTKVDALVYKIELLLHNMSNANKIVRKAYEKFKVQGEYDSEDDR